MLYIFSIYIIITVWTMYSKGNKNSKTDQKIIKIGDFIYQEKDIIGQGYSSTVYKGKQNKQKTSHKN